MDRRGSSCQAHPVGNPSVKVLAVDDHQRFLDVIQAVVEATPGFVWAGGATTGEQALAEADREVPDVALIDVNMPEMDGFEVARRLRARHPETLVALISAHHPDELPQATADSGVEVTLPKESLSPAWLREFWRGHRH